MNKLLKQYWFVVLVALVFLGGIIFFVNDSLAGVTSAKKVDGKDVVFSINNTNYTADQLYDELEDQVVNNLLVMSFEQAVISQSVELTADQITDAKLQADELWANYQTSLWDLAESTLDSAMQSIGFTDHTQLDKYFEFMTARQQVIDAYLEANMDAIWPEFEEEYSPRFVSHIIVTIDDFDNITAEEQELMDTIDSQLASGKSFSEVAKEYSEDSSATAGGSLGYTDKDSSLVKEFLDAALAQKAGDVSGWVKSQFGFHLIKTDATDYESLKSDTDFQNAFYAVYPEITGNAIWQEAEKLNIDYHGDTELEALIKDTLGVGELGGSQE